MSADWEPEKSFSKIPPEERVRQLFMLGFEGKGMEGNLKEILEELRPGGIIIFSRNVESCEQLRALTFEANQLSLKLTGTPLLISVDQEGGLVARIREGLAVFPGNMALGATYSPKNAYLVGKAIGDQLRWLGISVNLAPVLDIVLDKTNPSIGVRSFGDDVELVSTMGRKFIAGLRDSGIIAVAKHFPGIGAASVDPHEDLPVLNFSLEFLMRRELVPFIHAIEEGVHSIMPSHVLLPKVDSEMPASLSKKLIEGVLRQKLGFRGAVLSDDLLMGAISRRYSTREACLLALNAGEDMLLICRDLDEQAEAMNYLIEAVKRGVISRKRVNESVLRVMELKRRIRGLAREKPDFERLFHLERKICKESITLLRYRRGCLPLSNPRKRILMLCPVRVKKLVEAKDGLSTMGMKLKRKGFEVEEVFFEEKKAEEAIEKSTELASWADIILICTWEVLRHPEEAKLVKELKKLVRREKCLIVVSLGTPYDILAFPEVENYLVAYDYHKAMQEALIEVLLGKARPEGRLPVCLDDLFRRGYRAPLAGWEVEG